MREKGVYEEAGKAVAEQGQVMLDGPDGIAISMTPEAAEGTAHALLRAASDAKAQRSSPLR
ncbi:hypothetical protein U5A82_14130 [Sphingobium sp. CR2-8]|uniref:hypothetical protein n=1 Tax=Sphingobium sp. CR2-8 TaxID=1306534 RepID=UPI002DB5706A|nr:hypothetical protein [Sphingobium sp. CR2-8]MEC3911561.1 hypothetical protein [Sphingobium sp. CR2-8]